MTSLPVNVVNLICEWAAQDDMDRYPFFCPKTHKLSWKINKYSKNLIEKGNIILHDASCASYVIEGAFSIYDKKNFEAVRDSHYRGILFQHIDGLFDIYIESDSEKDITKKDKYIYRAMLKFNKDDDDDEEDVQTSIRASHQQYLYLNGTNYGEILDALFNYDDKEISLYIESF
jgi:hypothetical protein